MAKNAEKVREYNKKYYRENITKEKERIKKYHDAHREELKASSRKYYTDNIEYFKNRTKSEAGKLVTWKSQRRLQGRFNSLKSRAKLEGKEFSITLEDLFFPTHCPLLGIELNYFAIGNDMSSPSVDRFDNTKGYIKGNVWVISRKANAMKYSATAEELIKFSQGMLNMLAAQEVL